MPVKLSIGLSRKIGLPDYSSLGANCQIELELESAILSRDPVGLGDQARRAYAACAEAVEDALQRHRPADPGSRQAGHRSTANNGRSVHRYTTLPATAKQLEFARKLATQIPGMEEPGLEAFSQERWGKPSAGLDRTEASQLIDALRQIVVEQHGFREMPQGASRRDADDWRTSGVDERDDRHDSANGSPEVG